MRNMKRRAARQGFTLVELIIVIIILGIIAAIAIPQFTSSTEDAETATLKSNLAIVRNAIQLYYHEHDQKYPGAMKDDGSGAASAGEAAAAFTNQLLQYSKKTGEVSADKDAAFEYGPYLTEIPVNPLNGKSDVKVLVGDSSPVTTGADTDTGWVFNAETGQLRAVNEAGSELVDEAALQ